MGLLQDFISKHTNQKLDYDGAYGAQCVDLIKYWFKALGLPIPTGNGNQYARNADGSRVIFIKNTPSGIPKPGDVIVWNTGIGAYGHVAIFVEGDVNSFRSFDQNYPLNSSCHIQNHSYNHVDGWLHPVQLDTPAPPPPPPPPPVDPRDGIIADLTDRINKANALIAQLRTDLTVCQSRPPQVVEVIKEVIKEVPVVEYKDPTSPEDRKILDLIKRFWSWINSVRS